jgi:hypothetical protein
MVSECSWFICNDESIKNLGNWTKTKEYLISKDLFPSLIFYEENDEVLKEQGKNIF